MTGGLTIVQCFERFSAHQLNKKDKIPLDECKTQIQQNKFALKDRYNFQLEQKIEDLKYEYQTTVAVAKGETIDLLKKNFDFQIVQMKKQQKEHIDALEEKLKHKERSRVTLAHSINYACMKEKANIRVVFGLNH